MVQSLIDKEERRRAEEQANLRQGTETGVVQPSYLKELVSLSATVRESLSTTSVVAALPPSEHEKRGSANKESADIDRASTLSTSSITPPERTSAISAQKPAAGLFAFGLGGPEEPRAVVHKKNRASDGRSDNIR